MLTSEKLELFEARYTSKTLQLTLEKENYKRENWTVFWDSFHYNELKEGDVYVVNIKTKTFYMYIYIWLCKK